MQQTSSGQPEEQETTISVTPVSVTATSGDNAEEPNIPSIRIVGADDQQRGSTEATESGAMPSEGTLIWLLLIANHFPCYILVKFLQKNLISLIVFWMREGKTLDCTLTYLFSFPPHTGVSSDSEKRPEEPVALASGDDDAADTAEVTEESTSELVEDDVEEESREAEASPSSNTRQRTMAASLAAAASASNNRGVTVRRSPRSPFRAARGARPTPIVWGESQSGRGEQINECRGN